MIIHELQALANLSVAQISRLFGVPTRSLWNWQDTVPQRYQEHYHHVVDTITALGANPAERKIRLLDSKDGMSVMHQLINAAPRHQQIQSTVPVHHLLGLDRPAQDEQ